MKIYSRKGIIYLDYSVDGKRYRKTTKLPDTRENIALVKREVIPQLRASIARGEYRQTAKQLLTTLKDFGYRSLELHRHERNKRINTVYKQNFEMHILPYFKDTLLKDITPLQLHEWQNTIIDKTSASSSFIYRNIFNQIFEDAILAELIEVNPFGKIKRPKVKEVEIKPFTKEEIEATVKLLTPKMRNFFIIAIFTGMRTGEQIALTWNDIDFTYKHISISKTMVRGVVNKPKTRSSTRIIDMIPIVEEYLRKQFELTGHQEFVFTNKDGKQYQSGTTINVSLKTTLAKIGITDRVLYNTRHTFASMMLSNNENIMWVSKTMGHRTANITFERYGRYMKDDTKSRADFVKSWHIFDTVEN